MAVYYNEFDPKKAAWLRELIKDGVIADGEVDERDIREVTADDVRSFRQCHWFAGQGSWSYALRLAGIPEDAEIDSASCPCPPFSQAGRKKSCPRCASQNLVPHVGRTGFFVCCACDHEWLADDRHLWPELWRILRDRMPNALLGEQVASNDGITWFSLVRASLEILGYTIRGADLPAASVGAPHIRQRLWFLANADGWHASAERQQRGGEQRQFSEDGGVGELGDTESDRRIGRSDDADGRRRECASGHSSEIDELGDAGCQRLEIGSQSAERRRTVRNEGQAATAPSFVNGFWADAEWIACTDGKARPAKRGIQPLVNGSAARMVRGRDQGTPINANQTSEARTMRLRGYGDGIVAPLAAEFIKAVMS